ncbi:MAG: ribbon-helix-helix domain-containing protein [Candidatus Bathyarchaeota archaeon]
MGTPIMLQVNVCMKLITINLPETYLRDLEKLVKEDLYPNRAEAIRVAVRDMLVNEVWEKKKIRDIEL